MKVLHVGKFYPPAPGGMERVVQLLCENERPEVDSVVLAANTSPHTVREVWHGVPVTRVASVASIGSVGICPTFPAVLGAHAARYHRHPRAESRPRSSRTGSRVAAARWWSGFTAKWSARDGSTTASTGPSCGAR